MFKKTKFVHTTEMESIKRVQAKELVDVLMKLFTPSSVADVGCGTATMLNEFKKRKVLVHGYDGKWANKELLFQNIEPSEFTECDLEKPLAIKGKVDLVLCLEVAEHLSAARADGLVKDLASMADVVVFSAAIPRQGGQNHINEQWPSYWQGRFAQYGFQCHDVLKSLLCDNEKILWWYRQNMVVYTKNTVVIEPELLHKQNYLTNVIHPVLFSTVVDYREKNAVKRFLKGFIKALLYKAKIIR